MVSEREDNIDMYDRYIFCVCMYMYEYEYILSGQTAMT